MQMPETNDTTANQISERPKAARLQAEDKDATDQVPTATGAVPNRFEYRDGLFSVPLNEVPPEFLLRVVQGDLRMVVIDLSNIRHRLSALGEHADSTFGSVTEAMATLALAQAQSNRIRLPDQSGC